MKKLILFSLFFGYYFNYSQTYTSGFPIELGKKSIVYSYDDFKNNEAFLIVANKGKTKAIHYSSTFSIKDSLSFHRINEKYENIAGLNFNETQTNVFWLSDDEKNIALQSINFKNKSTETKNIDLDFSKEKILQSFSTNSKFYLLTILKNSSVLKIYIFDKNGNSTEQKIDMSKTAFFGITQKILNLYDVFDENLKPFENSFELPIINLNLPNSLALTAKKRKCYFDENKIIITFDNNINSTQIIELNLTDYSFVYRTISKPLFDITEDFPIKSNSIIINNNMCILKVNEEKLAFVISDLDGNIIKEYIVNKNDTFNFKNSPFFSNYVNPDIWSKKIESTEDFIKVFSHQNVGISYFNYNNKNLITIGGISKNINKIDKEAQSFLSNYGLLGGLIYLAFYNQNQTNLDFSRDTAYTYCLMDDKFNRIDEPVKYYVLDLFKNFFNSNPNAIFPTLITLQNGYYLGYYNPKTKKYNLLNYDK